MSLLNRTQVSASLRAKEVEVVLRRSAWQAVRCLRVAVLDGFVTLTGHVGSYYHKQVAYQEVRRIPGVAGVTDLVEVRCR